jgi:molecular chaperone HscB
MTHFELLGLPRRYDLDPAEVEANYLRQSRQIHPDYHQLATSAEQRASLELTAALNEAYAVLRDPFRRAEYLLALEGGPTAAEHKELPHGFLEETLETRMEIEEARANDDAAAKSHMEQALRQRLDGRFREVADRFRALEATKQGDPNRPTALREVRALLNTAKYLQGLLRDLRAD